MHLEFAIELKQWQLWSLVCIVQNLSLQSSFLTGTWHNISPAFVLCFSDSIAFSFLLILEACSWMVPFRASVVFLHSSLCSWMVLLRASISWKYSLSLTTLQLSPAQTGRIIARRMLTLLHWDMLQITSTWNWALANAMEHNVTNRYITGSETKKLFCFCSLSPISKKMWDDTRNNYNFVLLVHQTPWKCRLYKPKGILKVCFTQNQFASPPTIIKHIHSSYAGLVCIRILQNTALDWIHCSQFCTCLVEVDPHKLSIALKFFFTSRSTWLSCVIKQLHTIINNTKYMKQRQQCETLLLECVIPS